MIEIKLSDKQIHEEQGEGYVLFVEQPFVITEKITEITKRFYPLFSEVVTQRKFMGSAGSTLIINGILNDRAVYLILVGLGTSSRKSNDLLEQIRRSSGQVIRVAEQLKIKDLCVNMPDANWCHSDNYTVAKAMASAFEMATYHFDQYITDESRKHRTDYSITICAPSLAHDRLFVGMQEGQHIGYAVNQARHWCDLPACVLTPTAMAEHAQRIAKNHDLKVTIFDEQTIIKMGMGGLASVSKGSEQECRFVIMEYKAPQADAETIGLVGKGVTFDSGGLSIKPAARMDEMKDDMAGAAAVISSMELIAHLRPSVNVIAIAPLTENLPSGTATKPGDIVQFYNGKTAEIKNTDAEGRLILADALSYMIKHYKTNAIINFATLTGACSYALGPFFCGLMSQHDILSQKVINAATWSGDRAWALPFHDDYRSAIRSTTADICNIGNETYRAGSITAGFFLKNFVDDTIPWVHLDIAGTSFNVPDISYYRPGATGFGVRLIAELVNNWSK